MKRTISLWLGLLAFAFYPRLRKRPPRLPPSKGPLARFTVTSPDRKAHQNLRLGKSLTDGGHTNKFTFQVTPQATMPARRMSALIPWFTGQPTHLPTNSSTL